MTIFFKSRTALRNFASTNGVKKDKGAAAGAKRWAFVIGGAK